MALHREDNRLVSLFIDYLADNEQCRKRYAEKYPREFEWFERFSKRNGRHCPFARSAARSIFSTELHTNKDEFVSCLEGEGW
jgi:hypothetical protein